MEKESNFARVLRCLEKEAASDEPNSFERLAAYICESADEDSTDPRVQVLRSAWGRANAALAARLTAAIKYVGREDTLRVLLVSDLGRSNPKRACELALEGSKLSAADVVRDDFDPREKEFDDLKTREMEAEG
jgi:hypothetical protein